MTIDCVIIAADKETVMAHQKKKIGELNPVIRQLLARKDCASVAVTLKSGSVMTYLKREG